MDALDKAILGSFYLTSLESNVDALDRLRSRLPLPTDIYNEKIQNLVDRGFIEKNDESKLTFLGRDAFKVVLVGGVFDLIHPGHIHTLKSAKAQGDVLIVVIARISTAAMIKKDRRIYHDESLRVELVSSLRLVDLAILGREGTLYETVEHIKPDVIALGYDQAHSEKDIADNCRKRNLNVKVVRLNTPVPGTKSSEIKDYLGESFYRI
ncbi:MAG TPA: adenylyltransferase/cytidyltransferase family protein [Candidatus Nitrosopolaris sp.]|nr:adenylyltransferase/cytidyltransferase family protein [Candidatus Nitrosopolaris sp.]